MNARLRYLHVIITYYINCFEHESTQYSDIDVFDWDSANIEISPFVCVCFIEPAFIPFVSKQEGNNKNLIKSRNIWI